MANEIVVSGGAEMFMPVMDVRQAVMRRDALVGFVQGIMKRDTDFGTVPGTGTKPTLLKPGAEKLTTFFGLAPVFVSERIVEEFGDDGREPLFFYRYRCELYRAGTLVGSGIGSCNSRESKYRYRNDVRKCPECGKAAIIKGKEEYGGGWLCFKKKDGCGAKFEENDPAIINQSVGKVPNPDVADLVNTIDKMAQKRALIAAVLIAVNASEFFTQDVEDMVIDAEYTVTRQENGSAPTVTAAATERTTTGNGNSGNGNGHAKPANGDAKPANGDAFKRYAAAKEAARKSGKFGSDKHLDAAWSKMFSEYKARDAANAGTFLSAWAAYVEAHEPVKPARRAELDAITVESAPELDPDAAASDKRRDDDEQL